MGEGQAGPRYEAFLRRAEPWREALEELRRIILECGLTEEIKWGAPCFTSGGRNVVMLNAFKDDCCASFFKGALLADPEGVLEAPGENTRAARLIRFTDVDGVVRMEPVLRAYVQEAAALEKAGATVDFAKGRDDVPVPDELDARLAEDPVLAEAWAALTPGRRRGWLIHFTGAKRSATRAARIDRAAPRIIAGKGIHDR